MDEQQRYEFFRDAKKHYQIFTVEVNDAINQETFAYKLMLRREISKITSQLLLCQRFFKGKRKAETTLLIQSYYSLLADLGLDTS